MDPAGRAPALVVIGAEPEERVNQRPLVLSSSLVEEGPRRAASREGARLKRRGVRRKRCTDGVNVAALQSPEEAVRLLVRAAEDSDEGRPLVDTIENDRALRVGETGLT